MKRFTSFLTEGVDKNTHIEHLEDLMLAGPQGTTFAFRVLRELGAMLAGTPITSDLQVSLKWDGSPAIVFGTDVQGFFVGTKSVFNVQPKLVRSHLDVHQYPEAIHEILHTCLDELPALEAPRVLQGDLLFLGKDVVRSGIDWPATSWYYTFKPNTLTYAVPVLSPEGVAIEKAVLGIALHTEYQGQGYSLRTLNPQPLGVGTYLSLRKTPRVFTVDPRLTDAAFYSSIDHSDFLNTLHAAEEVIVPESAYTLMSDMAPVVSRFLNYTVRIGASWHAYVYYEKLIEWLGTELTSRAQAFRDAVIQNAGVEAWFQLWLTLNATKLLAMDNLDPRGPFSTFRTTEDDNYMATGPEGFVVYLAGKTVKLVNRKEFSRLNFANHDDRQTSLNTGLTGNAV